MPLPQRELPIDKNPKPDNANDAAASKTQYPGGESGGGDVVPTGLPPDGPQPPTNPAHPNPGDRQPHKYHPNWVEVGTFILEFLGVAGLVWYCCINQGELGEFRRQSKTFEEDTIATRQQVVDAEAGQRAWLHVEGATAKRITNSDNQYKYDLQVSWGIKNYGATPATEFTVLGANFPPLFGPSTSTVKPYVSGSRTPQPAKEGQVVMPQQIIGVMAIVQNLAVGDDQKIDQWFDFRDVFGKPWTIGAFAEYNYGKDTFTVTRFYVDQFHGQNTTN